MNRRKTTLSATALLVTLCGFMSCAWAAVVVSNYGIDSGSCGSSAKPCRSISQAIENASPGDTIWVSAGRYGDLTGNGSFSGPGDEHAAAVQSDPLSPFHGCIVCVTKHVHIYSYAGAAATTIDSGPSPGIFNTSVYITADGAQFGSPGHGFTITGGNAIGVGVDLALWTYSRTGVIVAGNTDLKDGVGFEVIGPQGCGLPGCICPPEFGNCPPTGWYGSVAVYINQAFGNGAGGFSIEPRHAYGLGGPGTLQFVLRDNLASGAGTGFNVEPGASECDGCLNGAGAYEVSVTHNAASSDGVGFALFLAGGTFDNLATNNSVTGFWVTEGGSAQPFKRNSAIGNGGPGVLFAVLSAKTVNLDSFSQNSFYNNDRRRPPLPTFPPLQPDPGPSARCGVLDVGAVAGYAWGEQPFNAFPPYPAVTLQAAGNYWGSMQGPQAQGPGDTAGGACDQNGAITIAKPFSTTPANLEPVP